MRRKCAMLLLVLVLTLAAVAPVAYAETASSWSQSYSGVQFQYVNQFGGNDWDGLRWYNGNSRKVEVSYTIKLSNGGTTRYLIYLEKGETSNPVIAIAAGERVNTISVK